MKIEHYESHKYMKLIDNGYRYVGDERKFFLLFYCFGALAVACFIFWPYEWYKIILTVVLGAISAVFFFASLPYGYIKDMELDHVKSKWSLSFMTPRHRLENQILNFKEIDCVYFMHYGNLSPSPGDLNMHIHIEMKTQNIPLACQKESGPRFQLEGIDSHSKMLDFAKRLAQILEMDKVVIERNDPLVCIIRLCRETKAKKIEVETTEISDLHTFYQSQMEPLPQLQKIVCKEWNPEESEIVGEVEYRRGESLVIKYQEPKESIWLMLLIAPVFAGIFTSTLAIPYFFFADTVLRHPKQIIPFFVVGYLVSIVGLILYILILKRQNYFAPQIHQFDLRQKTWTISDKDQQTNFDLNDANNVILSIRHQTVRTGARRRSGYKVYHVYFAVVRLSGLDEKELVVGQTQNYPRIADAYHHGLYFANVFCQACDKNLTLDAP
ncbi:hypothetical protein [Candidatus Uabimicrobium amorphum]|uniref:Uncharacterized protein n=1 Tax=Uabimicrobium amorphum TaxID=2596890 RepID=A0A5S9F6F3_UABAM|nr:hypothetical protein [Candidatus Uabimicrobium amorphum]BBM86619.1 hypothetical protein UABAM_05005 [Candidatus Uabimicrobium amorphum]